MKMCIRDSNTALDAAAGEYITYLDSDDFAVAKAYPNLLQQAVDTKLSLIPI